MSVPADSAARACRVIGGRDERLRDAIDFTTLGWIKPELDETLRQARIDDRGLRRRSRRHQPHALLRQLPAPGAGHAAHGRAVRAGDGRRGNGAARAGVACGGHVARSRRSLRDADARRRAAARLPRAPAGRPQGHSDRPAAAAQRTARGARRNRPERKRAVRARPAAPVAGTPQAPASASRQARGARPRRCCRNCAMRCRRGPNDGAPATCRRDRRRHRRPARADRRGSRPPHVVGRLVGGRRIARWRAAADAGAAPGVRQRRARNAPPVRRTTASGRVRDAALEPTRQLLYHVAHADGEHAALQRPARHVRPRCAGAAANPNSQHARGSLTGRNRALLDTVSAAIKEDLLRVKDALDLHLRSGQADVAGLQPQVEALGRVADTLGMLGLGVARNVVQQQRDAMHALVSRRAPRRRRRAARYRRRAALRRRLARRAGRASRRPRHQRRRKHARQRIAQGAGNRRARGDRQFRRCPPGLRRLRGNQLGPRRTGRSPAAAAGSQRRAADARPAATGRLPDRRAAVCRARTDRAPSRAQRPPAGHAGRCAGEP